MFVGFGGWMEGWREEWMKAWRDGGMGWDCRIWFRLWSSLVMWVFFGILGSKNIYISPKVLHPPLFFLKEKKSSPPSPPFSPLPSPQLPFIYTPPPQPPPPPFTQYFPSLQHILQGPTTAPILPFFALDPKHSCRHADAESEDGVEGSEFGLVSWLVGLVSGGWWATGKEGRGGGGRGRGGIKHKT